MQKNLLSVVLYCFWFSCKAQLISVYTQRYDNQRVGWNPYETKFTTSNVDSASFGLLFSRPVDDQTYGQPLLIPNLHIKGGLHDVVFVTTVNNSVYAYDASIAADTAPLWQTNLTPLGTRVIRNTDMTGACGGYYMDFSGNIGIVGTPVIDTFTQAIYMVSRDITFSGGVFQQYIHALDIYTGQEKPWSPVLITASYPGAGDGNPNDTVYFDEQKENQRPALLLFNRNIYLCWAGHCDWQNYHGWVMAYSDTTLQKTYTYNTTPDGGEGGIWMGGLGPVVDDSGYIYVVTGNGTVGNNGNPNDPRDRGESLLKLLPSGDTLAVIDFFTPDDYQILNDYDLDYGTCGTLNVPGTTVSITAGKEGIMYLANTSSMGMYSAGDDSVYEEINVNQAVEGTPVYFSYNSGATQCVYVWSSGDTLRQFFINPLSSTMDSLITGNIQLSGGTPGAMMTVSSKGQTPGTGVLWALHPLYGDANQSLVPGQLDVYDATNVTHQLWNSQMNSARDSIGIFSKFNFPMVANGKVYVPTFSGTLNVYGLYNTSIDTVLLNDTIVIRDTLSFIDTLYYTGASQHSDTTQSVSILSSSALAQITDTVHAIDTIVFVDTLRITDTLHITDSIPFDTIVDYHIIITRDTITNDDTVNYIGTGQISDTIQSVNTISDTTVAQIFDTVHGFDTIVITETFNITDTLNVTDSIGILAISNVGNYIAACYLYPNPVAEELTVKYILSDNISDLNLVLVDIYGRVLLRVPLPGKSGQHIQTILLSDNIAAGLYDVLFEQEGQLMSVGKVVKE